MNQPLVDSFTHPLRWTSADLELLPEDERRYEIIDGELHVTRAPHWKHQNISLRLGGALEQWSQDSGRGETTVAPGVLFDDADNVIPDIVWASHERLADSLDEAGHLTAAPELIVEILSPGDRNQRRDRDLKLRLYSARGVREYWIVSRHPQQIEAYRREAGVLALAATFLPGDQISTPLLPGFSYRVDRLFR
jgi:Uma2 family endonuclease